MYSSELQCPQRAFCAGKNDAKRIFGGEHLRAKARCIRYHGSQSEEAAR
jgi:hypothetical protein